MLHRHTVLYALARGLPGLLAFLTVALYTRLLTPAQYGIYALVLALSMFGNALLFWWLKSSILRYYSTPHRESVLSTALFFYYTLGGLLSVTAIVLFIALPKPLGLLAALGLLISISLGFFEAALELARAQLKPKLYGSLSITKAVLAPLLTVILIRLGFGTPSPLIGLLLATFLPTAANAKDLWLRYRPRLLPSTTPLILKYGIPLGLTFLLSYVVGYTDRFMIAYFLGQGPTGVYAASYDLAFNGINMLAWIVGLASVPLVLSSYEKEGPSNARTRMKYNFRLLSFLLVPMTVATCLYAPNLTELLLGADFQENAELVLALSAIAAALHGYRNLHFDIAFQITQKTRYQAYSMGIAATTNIFLNLYAIPHWGLPGAAGVTVASYLSALAASYLWSKQVWRVPIDGKMAIRAGVLALASFYSTRLLATLTFKVSFSWMIGLALGGILFVGLCLVITQGELRKYLTGE